jgi:hypothetical protein
MPMAKRDMTLKFILLIPGFMNIFIEEGSDNRRDK